MKDCKDIKEGVCLNDGETCEINFKCDDYVSNKEPAKDYNFLIIMVVIAVLTVILIVVATWFRS